MVEKEFPEVNKCCKMLQDLLQVLGRFLLVLVPWHMGVSKIRVPQNGWFIMEKPIKMDDLGVPLFLETSISITSWKNMILVETVTHPWPPFKLQQRI